MSNHMRKEEVNNIRFMRVRPGRHWGRFVFFTTLVCIVCMAGSFCILNWHLFACVFIGGYDSVLALRSCLHLLVVVSCLLQELLSTG
jgi:hypothetical protein